MLAMIPEDIQSILEDRGLVVTDVLQTPDTGRRRFYSIRVRERGAGCAPGDAESPSGRDLVIKIFGRGDPGVISNFGKESQFLKLVSVSNSPLSRWVPRFIAGGTCPQPWYIREFAPGEFLGDICVDFGIRSEFLTSELLESLVGFFPALWSFPPIPVDSISLTKHGYEWYERDRLFYQQHLSVITAKQFELVGQLLRKRRCLLDAAAKYLVHGDLYLKNMFWSNTSGGRFTVTDWELLSLGNPAFDPGFVWSLAWQAPSFRSQLLDRLAKSFPQEDCQYFSELFEVAILSVSLRLIRHSEVMDSLLVGEAKENAKLARAVHLESIDRVLGGEGLFSK